MTRFALAVFLAFGLSLSVAEASSRYRDWRDAVKAGDFPAAYEDLFQTWRNGTPEPRAQALRNAWRNPQIVAVARGDFQRILKPIAEAHIGDLASLRKAVRKGPLEDRVDFAAVVDRKLDVDREIALAFEARGLPKAAAPATSPSPELKAAQVPIARDTSPATSPSPTAVARPAETVPLKVPGAATAPPVPVPVAPSAAQVPAQAPAQAPSPWSTYLPGVDPSAVDRAARSDLPPEVAAAKARSVWRCKAGVACDRGWAAAEAFVMSNANMRVRTAKSPLIETYPPITLGEVGLRVDRVEVGNGESEFRLTVACRAGKLRQACTTAELRIYPAFPAFLDASR